MIDKQMVQLSFVEGKWSLSYYPQSTDPYVYRLTLGEYFRVDDTDYVFEVGDVAGDSIRLLSKEEYEKEREVHADHDCEDCAGATPPNPFEVHGDRKVRTMGEAKILQQLLQHSNAVRLIVSL